MTMHKNERFVSLRGRLITRILIPTLTTLFLVSLTAPFVRAQFLHPKIKSKEITIRTVVVLPAKVNVVRDSMKGPEGMAAESDELGGRVEQMISEVLLKTKQVNTLPRAGAPSSDASSQQQYNVADFQTKFDELLPKIMKKRSDVKKGRFSMGDEVLNLNVEKSADAIVFIRGEGKKLTSGKTAFTLLVGGMPAYLRLQIGMVDARNGDVLLYTDPIFPGDPTTAVDRLRKALESGLKKLPAVGAK
ncbi:MAG TPA: hypothetical protein VLE19_13360 [Pyrinomonadaceae bacterium]|nr:hypothetical protein [Pyrinomonadaceae bacterium]